MKTRVDARFRDEVARFRLMFQCESCVHFVVESGDCCNGYPNAAHRSQADDALGVDGELTFCKEFELG